MSRLKSYEVFQKAPVKLRRISVRRSGTYVFATIAEDSFVKRSKSQRFYLLTEPFGLCSSNQNNPAKISVRGLPGDYVAADENGDLTRVTAEDYARKFPKPITNNMAMPQTSDDFLNNNPNAIENRSSLNSNESQGNTSNGNNYVRPTTARPTY